MDTVELLLDRPVLVPPGKRMQEVPCEGLSFTRCYHATIEQVAQCWLDPSSRQAWMPLIPNMRFAIVQHVFPAFVRTMESDGTYTVEVQATFKEEGTTTRVLLNARPLGTLSLDGLIDSGYADLWEERLYALADMLLPRTPQQQ